MGSVVWICVEFLVNCFDFMFVILICTFQLNKRREWLRDWHIACYIILCSVLLLIYNYMTDQSITSMIVLFVFYITYAIFCTQDKLSVKIFWIITPMSSAFFIDRIVIDFILDVYKVELVDIAAQGKYRIMAMIIAKSIELIILAFSYKFKLTLTKEYRFLIIPIAASILVPYILILKGYHIWLMTSIFLVINIYYLTYLYYRSKVEEARRRKEIMRVKNKTALENALLRQYLRQYQGDVNDKLKIIWEKMKDTDSIAKGDISDDMYNINLSLRKLYDTGDDELDMLLSLKEALAESKGIEFKSRIMSPLSSRINFAEVSTILAELIDNAIKAIEDIPQSEQVEKLILLTIAKDNNCCIIEIENPTNDERILSLKTLLSNKIKGQGLKTVNSMVNQMGGTFEISHSEGYFMASIEIPSILEKD